MPVFKGTTSGSILQVAANIPSSILSGIITNNTGGNVTVNVYVRDINVVDVRIAPKDNSLAAGASFYLPDDITLLAGSAILITSSGSIDYYISLD